MLGVDEVRKEKMIRGLKMVVFAELVEESKLVEVVEVF